MSRLALLSGDAGVSVGGIHVQKAQAEKKKVIGELVSNINSRIQFALLDLHVLVNVA